MKTKLQSDGTSCPAALLRLGVPSQRLTHFIFPLLILHKIEKSYTLMSEGYLSLGDKQGTDEALNNIFPAKTDVLPGYDPFQCLVVLQRHWQKFMEFTGKEEIRSNIWEIIENGTGKDIVD